MYSNFLVLKPYVPPLWAKHLIPKPSHMVSLGHLPTPIHKWNLPNLPTETEVWLKRDDLTGVQLTGNKVRKLEFLMADAMARGADSIVTSGYIQSNHCRAAAAATTYLNLESHLILRTDKVVYRDPGLKGNLLVVVQRSGLKRNLLLVALHQQISFESRISAYNLRSSSPCLEREYDKIGSKVHAYAVCDDPEYFYDVVQRLTDDLGAGLNSRDIIEIHNAKGVGYTMSTAEELKFVKDMHCSSYVPVSSSTQFTGEKAAHAMMKDMAKYLKQWEGRKVLFVHTGGHWRAAWALRRKYQLELGCQTN